MNFLLFYYVHLIVRQDGGVLTLEVPKSRKSTVKKRMSERQTRTTRYINILCPNGDSNSSPFFFLFPQNITTVITR